MAQRSESKTKLMINVETGTKSDGTPIVKARTISNVNPALTDDDILAVGNALGQLQTNKVSSISRQDTAALSAQA